MFVDSLLRVGVVDLTVVEHSARDIVPHRSSTNINEPVGLHGSMAAARHQHTCFNLP